MPIAAGNSTTAAEHYQNSLTITERLATADPGNAEYQRDLSIIRQRLEALAANSGNE